MSSIWALMASWLTSTWLFPFLSLTILTMFLTSHFGSHKKPSQQHQLAHAPSLLDRVRSFNFSLYKFQQTNTTPITEFLQPDHANLDHPPAQLTRPPLLDRLNCFNFSSLCRSDSSAVPEMGSANLSQSSLGTSTLATSSMAFDGPSSSSSSSSISRWDVFLSFRGKDTRNNFTAHLCAALRREGILTFMDDKLRTGEKISPALVKAIEESDISIIVLSKNYTSSQWCLDELMKIIECRKIRRQKVLPLFYDVDPSEVRHQTKSVGKAFATLEKRFKDDVMKVQRWKTVLKEVADLSGSSLANRNEPEFIQEIIEWVNSRLVNNTYFQVAQFPVGIKSRLQDVKLLLDIEKKIDRTCMVGIFGTGGIDKTTLAKAIYNSIASQFEGSCFLENIRETYDQQGGLIQLQNKLLSKILGGSNLMVDNVDEGITLIEQRLRLKRLLIVLDDVDHSNQLEKIAGNGDLFGLGSRIIITTREKHLLTRQHVLTYELKELDCNEALQLFSWHAFNKDRPGNGYETVTKYAIHYAGRLPLALVVLGSTLKGRDILYWESKLDEYKRIPHGDIHKKLKISFDGLNENAKNIFLDIACFFNGMDVKYVTKILDRCGFYPKSSIKELEDKSLLSEYCELFVMHDLLQEMGREIVRQESPKEPGKRSRLWFHEDVRHVLEENTGSNEVEGIVIDLPKPDLIRSSPKSFKKMKRLRLFINHNAYLSEEPNFLSNELRQLDWPNYPGESFPSNFCGRNLVYLRMPDSHLKELKGVLNSQNLISMNFSNCRFLTKIPDVSRIPNLETFYLDGCTNLVEVHCSVGFLDKLVNLSLKSCSKLRIFPRSLKLRSLIRLVLGGCSSLMNFPEIECQMECLSHIDVGDTGIDELPSSIGYLIGVKTLNMGGCRNLKNLPDSIHKLQLLENLFLNKCTSIKELPSSLVNLVGLEKLHLNDCINFMNLPNGIYQLQHLESLNLSNCKQLQEILELPPNVKYVEASGCESLAIFLEEARRPHLINVWGPPDPVGIGMVFQAYTLRKLDLSSTNIVTIPRCIESFVGLEELTLENCKQL
ncbi:disease resistance protein RUN1-like [Corylus avellana]|uniref:disease resistance protein RUN1-like n=1 Tax=Corylus avellana TaxID=13451 RepID=UPI00286BCD59|nr:disease resistance protein RUN1-like [Corylus avellana]